jgi:hypothetical protein
VDAVANRADDSRMTTAQFFDRIEQELPLLRHRFAALHELGELDQLARDVDAIGNPLCDPVLAQEVRVRSLADAAAANLLYGLVDLRADIERERKEIAGRLSEGRT